MASRQTFQPASVPVPGGAYSPVVRVGDLVFVAGTVGTDVNERVAGDDVGSQTRQALRNIQACLEAAGASLADVCMVTTFLEHLDRDFKAYDAAYREFFARDFPARATVEAHLVGDPIVEIQVTAVISHD
jgi:2-iminobutanoate/2-iminopropanoate deaminase